MRIYNLIFCFINWHLFSLFFCCFWTNFLKINGQAPYDYGSFLGRNSDIFNQFAQSSFENIQVFKTKVFKLIETQNQYFELIQQKRPALGDYEYVKFDVLLPDTDYSFPLMDNQSLISVPKPNLPSNYTQLLLSIDQNSQIHLWQFMSDSNIIWIDKYRLKQTSNAIGNNNEHYECIKMKSFVFKTNVHKFRLQIVALFRQQKNHGQLDYHSNDFLLVLAINFLIQGSNLILQTSFIEEQVIKFERIPDFDLLYLSKTRVYLSLLQNSEYSNFKYELSLYELVNEKFDKIAWQISDYILNANHVKLASLDGSIFLICSYDTSQSRPSYFDSSGDSGNQPNYPNYINVFQLIENVDYKHGAKLIFISSVNNFTTTTPQQIHHLSSNNDFFFVVKDEDIDVYWWDGHSLIYYDTVIEDGHRPLSFALEKLPDQPPLILSTDGRTLTLYYKVYSKFIRHKLDLFIDNQYRLENIEIFTFNRQYFVWFKFANGDDSVIQPSKNKYYCQFARVQSRKPESNDEIHNLNTCLMDLHDRIDRGLREVKTLKRKSEDLLIISAEQPFVNVDVFVYDTFRTQRADPELLALKVPGNVIKGDRVVVFLDTISGRLDHLETRINNTVMLKTSDQTILSPILFQSLFRTEDLLVNSTGTHFYLNDINFDTYSNDSLTIDTDQTISSRYNFINGIRINQLSVNQVNGVKIKSAILINRQASIQFVDRHVDHRYHQIELLNGTTAQRINNVRLIDLYQDQPFPIQLLRGIKTFANISVLEVAIDTDLNQLNFRNFLSKIVWLDNPNITMQRMIGDWEFTNKLWIQNLSIINKINDNIDFGHFVSNTVKKNATSIVFQSPIHFQNHVNVNLNLIITGSINGLNLYEDVILLRGDQDFTKSSFPLVFKSISTSFTNLTIEVMNNRFRTDDFLRKFSNSKLLLQNKYFHNDLVVEGNLNMKPRSRMNNVDLSELYYKLDTLVSFSTPVTAKEIIVDGQVQTNQFNQFPSSYVRQRMANLLLANISQTFNIPLTYYRSLKVSKLSFDYFRNKLKFPEDFILKYDPSKVVIIGKKYFAENITVDNIYLGNNGTINGVRIGDLYDTVVKLQNNDVIEEIQGVKTFANLLIKGNVYVKDERINGYLLEETIDIQSTNEQIIHSPMFITNIIVNSNDFKVRDLKINQTINGVNYHRFWRDTVQKPSDQQYSLLKLYNKHFPDGLHVYNIQLTNRTINGIRLQNLMRDATTLDSNQIISSMIFFMNATFNRIDNFHTINNLDRTYFEKVVRKDSKIVHIHSDSPNNLESIMGYWHVKDLSVMNVNSYNITDLYHRTLKKNSAIRQTITAKHVFLKPLDILKLELPIDRVTINQVPIRNYVWLHSPTLIFNTDIIFENLKLIGNLTVEGLINQCPFNDIIRNSIKRSPDSMTFNLTGKYNVPKIIINGNARFWSTVNQGKNFIPDLVQVDDYRPLKHNLHFINDIIVQKISINNFINHRNLSILFHDGVCTHRAQRITGVKTFKKPLKIFGNIDQARGQFLVKNRFNHYNLTDLFVTSMKINDVRPISGRKIFTGNITFGKSIHLGYGLNGYKFPEDFVLTYTNETIYGQTNFHRKVHIHRNLNAELINRINVTRFLTGTIMINETTPKQVSSTVRFMHPIKILNLTVHKNVNDISVDDLVTRFSDDPIRISGRKTFKGDLVIEGQLNVQSNSINNVDLIRDIQNEWVDLRGRKNMSNGNHRNIRGQLIFEDSVHVGAMKINETLNGVPISQFKQELIKVENDISNYRQKVDKSFRDTKIDTRRIIENLTSNFHPDLRYFKVHQIIPVAIEEFYPISENDHETVMLIGVIHHKNMNNCDSKYQFRNYFYSNGGYIREYQMPHFWSNTSIILTQANNSLAIITLKNNCDEHREDKSDRNFVEFWNIFEFISILSSGVHDDDSILGTIHQKFSILDGNQIKSVRLFNYGSANYLLVLYRLKSQLQFGERLRLFKHIDHELFEMDRLKSLPFLIDFDLHEFSNLMFLSIVVSPHLDQMNNQTNQQQLFYWNSQREDFELYSKIHSSERYDFTKIISMSDRLLILYGQSGFDNCHGTFSKNSYNIDLLEVIQSGQNILSHFYQRISSKLRMINGVRILNIGIGTYLLAYSSSQIELYQFQGDVNKFQRISDFQVPGKIESIKDFWINNGEQQSLFLAISTSFRGSLILSTTIVGQLETTFNYHRLKGSVIFRDVIH